MGNEDNLLFYDIECFMYDSLVVIKDINNKEVAHYWSEPENGEFKEDSPNGFEKLKEVIKDKIMVGYNNFNYDDLILHKMKRGRPQSELKALNDRIIGGEDVSVEKREAHADMESIDCIQQIDVSRPSLKKIEGNMGKSIMESDIPFDIDRPLTDEEKEIVYAYCSYDVESTIAIYKLRRDSYFKTKEQLIQMADSKKCKRWNTTTISGNILLNHPEAAWEAMRLPEEIWRKIPGIPDEVWNMWEAATYSTRNEKKESKTYRLLDCDITFGFGGLHGVHALKHKFMDVKLLDVSSMYPSIIVELGALGKGTEKYEEIRTERINIKHTDKVRSQALKLILNSVYGNLKNQYSILYNVMAAVTVCVYGQISLFDLCRRLYEAGYTLVNINTDGVAFVDLKGIGNAYETIWHEWEKDFHLNLELDEFDLWLQKDVNNYLAKQGDHIKTKGGECNKYAEENLFSNNDARIIQIALVDKLMYGKDPLKTIMSHLDEPILYQYVLKAGHTYAGVYDKEGNQMQNVNRIFAAREDTKYPTTKLYKMRHDGGKVNFPDMPEHMYVFNDDLEKMTEFKDIIDINHYYEVVRKKLESWSFTS